MKAGACEKSIDTPAAHHGEERLELRDHGCDEVGELVDRDGGVHERAGLVLLNPAAPAGDGVVGDEKASAPASAFDQPRAAISSRMAMRSVGE
jgi:hypothetical protein